MEKILEELKEINKSIQYQTKLLEEIFLKKDDSGFAKENQQKQMINGFIGAVSDMFKSKGMDPAPFEKLLKAMGGNKNEHQVP